MTVPKNHKELEIFIKENIYKPKVAICFETKDQAVVLWNFLNSFDEFKNKNLLSLHTLIDDFKPYLCFRFSEGTHGWSNLLFYQEKHYKIYTFSEVFDKEVCDKEVCPKNKIRIINF